MANYGNLFLAFRGKTLIFLVSESGFTVRVLPLEPFALFAMDKGGHGGIQYLVKVLPRVFGQESQHKITVLLEQSVLPAIPPICLSVGEMLRAVQFDDHSGFGS